MTDVHFSEISAIVDRRTFIETKRVFGKFTPGLTFSSLNLILSGIGWFAMMFWEWVRALGIPQI